jgi:hypothetical protein
MERRNWTELFFLDEAVALAAGHRPCFVCPRLAGRRCVPVIGRCCTRLSM